MKSNTLAILILAYCILVACTRTSPNAQLVQADSLMQKFPDSALRFLQKMTFFATQFVKNENSLHP